MPTTAVTRIESPRFGTLEVSPEHVIEFPAGLPGFEEARLFTLFHPEGEDPKYFFLQSMEQPDVAFHIADPSRFGFTYEIALSDEESALIGLSNPADAVVAVILVKDDNASQPLRANLQAPLIINLNTRKGLQHVFSRLDYQVTLKSPA
ncbi:MAG: flagellar biosynthesis protein FliW [Rhodocyclaceae bacterium]|nr:MAG: flagellar biosynthesis protein FliW [Rhodocyclaceae bacterium]